jgi:hypothetical protein
MITPLPLCCSRRCGFYFFALDYAPSLRRLQEFDDGALFLASNVGTETHVMNDHIPLRVIIHCRWSKVMTAQAIVRPKLFAAEFRIDVFRYCTATSPWISLRFGKQIPIRASEE